MQLRTRMWIQLGGAAFFAGVLAAEVSGLKEPTFGVVWGPWIMAGACAVMLFEAWRTWRKEQKQPAKASEGQADSKMKTEKEVTG